MVAARIDTPDGISWHVERFAPTDSTCPSEHIVLIPSGEGDCQSLVNVAQILSSRHNYHVTTFDMPGFSRTTAPLEAVDKVTPGLFAQQITNLLDALKIEQASFFGCSSGGLAVLGMCATSTSRAKCGIIHEVPFDARPMLYELKKLSDDEVIATVSGMFMYGFIEQDENEGRKKWQALGDEYHERLKKNFVTWTRHYVANVEYGGKDLVADVHNLKKRPIFWTVGGLNEGVEVGQGNWQSNFETAARAGLKIETGRLRCLHFPAVTVPEALVAWIHECVQNAGL